MAEQKTELEKRDILRMSNEESHRLTKECLQTALILLMGEKPFERITVTELVKRAGVSRTAFYRSYSAKEDILNEITCEITDAIVKAFGSFKNDGDAFKWYCGMFETIRGSAKEFELLLRADLVDGVFREAMSQMGSSGKSGFRKYFAEAVFGAYTAVALQWFAGGMTESDEEMAAFCCRIRKAFENVSATKQSDR